MSCGTIWGILWCIPYSGRDLAKWILLANHVRGHQRLHSKMQKMPTAWRNYCTRCNAPTKQPPDRTIWCMWHWLNGTILKVLQQQYILVVVDYVSKWVEAIPCHAADSKHAGMMFHKVIFLYFAIPRMVISDGGSHFIDKTFQNFLKVLEAQHNSATPYHSQTSGQAETSNKQIKDIL